MINIDELIKNSMKSKNQVELRAYRNLKAKIQKTLASKNAPKYSESLFIREVANSVKSLEEAIFIFKDVQKEESKKLISEYRDELEVLKKLLPEPVEASDIEYILYNWADEKNFMDYSGEDLPKITIPKKEMGNAIKHLKSRFPQADGKMISEIVKKYIV